MNRVSQGKLKYLAKTMLLVGISIASFQVEASVLHGIKKEQIVTKGVTHIHEQLLMPSGWRNINVLKVNLKDKNVKVSPIESATGVERQTLLSMVQRSGAIAGVNADYFDMRTKTTPSLGMLINNGNVFHGYNSNYSTLGIRNNMATFMIDQNNESIIDYFGLSLKLYADGKFLTAIHSKNNIAGSVKTPIIIDNTYRKTTNDIVLKHPSVYSIVVKDGIAIKHSLRGQSMAIPEDGYVIIIPETLANEYYRKIKVGTSVKLEESLYLKNGVIQAADTMKAGIGGSGIIMRDGKAYTGSKHVVTPNSNVARTVVATVKNSGEILLITIDHAKGFRGINEKELIELLKRYNVEDAMYFDGGGSTTFVSADRGSNTPLLKNNPSDGGQRKIINGLGVFKTSKPGNTQELILSLNKERTFQGEPVTLYVKALDENKNLTSHNQADVTFKVEGGTGEFKGNTFTPTSSGKLRLTAVYKGIKQSVELNVSKAPTGLYVEPSIIHLNTTESVKVNVYGVDREGYKIPIDASKLKWSTNPKATALGGNVTAKTPTVTSIKVSYKGKEGELGIVAGDISSKIDSFEKHTATWKGNSQQVKGSVFPSSDIKYEGERSLKLTYTFKPSAYKQVAYAIFDKPMTVGADAKSINLWMYGRKQGHTAKLTVVDSEGHTHYLKVCDTIDFNGWKYINVPIPKEIKSPLKVTQFYVYSNQVKKEVTTAVYIDHFSITRGFREGTTLSTRQDQLFDPLYKPVLQPKTKNDYVIKAVGPTRVDSMLLNNKSIQAISNRLNEEADFIIKASTKNSALSLKPNSMTYQNSYQSGTYQNTRFITLGTASGGIRTTSTKGWLQFKESIAQSSKMKHIIITLDRNPLTEFNDHLEGKAFHQYLKETREKTGQNIFVLYAGGIAPEVRIEDGIRYIKVNGINVSTDKYTEGSFVKFKVTGDNIYYTFQKFEHKG